MRMHPALFLTVPALCAQAPQELTFSGQVLGPEGRPVVGALVVAVPEGGEWDTARRAYSDRDGRFQIAAKPGAYALTATKPGLMNAFAGKLKAELGKTPGAVTLQMAAGGHTVSGSLIDASGKPVTAAQVAFLRFSQDEGDIFYAHVDGGRFAITLGPGSYQLVTEAPGLLTTNQRIDLSGDLRFERLVLEPGPTDAGPVVKAWIKTQAVPLATVEAGHGFRDLERMREMVGNARVVSLGEATHGTREFFQMKHRMLEFLVERMGFTVFAIEANMPEARAVNDYVLEGKGDPAKALAGLYFWTWDTEEVLEMIRWMRRYNEDPKHTNKVKFYGFDMQLPPVAFASVKGFLAKVDPEGAAWVEAKLAELGSATQSDQASDSTRKAALLVDAKSLLARFDERKNAFVKAAGEDAYAWARQEARVLAQFAEMNADARGGYLERDRSMAENVQWILEQEKGAKAVLWAHNGHVSFDPTGAMAGGASMGQHLRKTLGQDMVVLGFTFLEGGFQAIDAGKDKRGLVPFQVKPNPKATLSKALASAGWPILALDLRKVPATGPVHDWFAQAQGHLDCGSVFSTEWEDHSIAKLKILDHFDGLFFMEKTTAARPNPSGRRGGKGSVTLATPAAAPGNPGF